MHLCRFVAVVILVFLCTSAATSLPLAANNMEFLDKALIEKLNSGIFEVVTPKKEDSGIQYARKLPYDRLSYAERNEQYHSIGTAFFINETDLMTAAHVFGLEYFSLLQDFYIRDRQGKVYPVNNILRISTHRDMVVFDLQYYPDSIYTLPFHDGVSIGDTVFSVGNVQGEGIAYRAGQVASFTPESELGKWQDIRFTSPASPGNSGGPLLNVKGEVVGLIVKKNESENYNISVPIRELQNLTDKAEFFLRNVTVGLMGVDDIVSRDWSFSVDLPAPLPEIAALSQEDLNNHRLSLTEELMQSVKEVNFPQGERFRCYLRDQSYIKGLAPLLPETNFQKWDVKGCYREEIPITASQSVYRGKGYVYDIQAIIEKPDAISLKEFLDAPALIMESTLKGVPYHREFGEESIPITSFGEPVESAIINDKLGRKWITSLWNVQYSDSFIYGSCLPYPKGAICYIDSKSNAYRKYGYIEDVHDSFDEVVVGYSGAIGDWQEYFSLGEKYLPAVFHNSSIRLEDGRLSVKLKDFEIEFSPGTLTDTSDIHIHLGYANDALLAEDILLFEIYPEKGARAHYRVQPFFQPTKFNSDSFKTKWKDIINGTGEFSGDAINKGEKIVIKKGIKTTKKTIAGNQGRQFDRIFAIGCYYKPTEKEIDQDCTRFIESVSFNRTTHLD